MHGAISQFCGVDGAARHKRLAHPRRRSHAHLLGLPTGGVRIQAWTKDQDRRQVRGAGGLHSRRDQVRFRGGRTAASSPVKTRSRSMKTTGLQQTLESLVRPSFTFFGGSWPFYGLFVSSGTIAGILFATSLSIAAGTPLLPTAAGLGAGLL